MSDGNVYDWIAMQQQALPEWIGGAGKNARYGEPDIGSQASQLNYVQDMMGTGADPLMLWLSGEMNNGSLASTFEEDKVVPGNTQGRNFLENVLKTAAPDSIESLIAEHILAGGSPIEAVKLAEQSGLIKPSMRDTYSNGAKVGQEPDTSERDYYLKWATDAQSKLMSDTEDQVTPGKEILHPFVQRMLDAGFADPRQQYTPDYVNPALSGMGQQAAGDSMGRADALANYKAMAGRVRDPQQVGAARDQMSQLNDLLHGRGGGAEPPQYEPLKTAQGQALPGIYNLDVGGGGFNVSGLTPTPRGKPVAASKPTAARKPYDPAADQKGKRVAFDQYRAAETKSAASNKQLTQERAKAKAVSNYLQSQGRSPALDQYQAAMQALMNRGIGR